ncbi:MAG: alpha/beta fold hydrolase [Thermoguttaceae bacterium]|nr:alpha/beta fold hydrolase [Thermoguttaceae bacterium]MDW8038323.1 alpha/beta fold hydrolase [Thermoguttaceae bacterium]
MAIGWGLLVGIVLEAACPELSLQSGYTPGTPTPQTNPRAEQAQDCQDQHSLWTQAPVGQKAISYSLLLDPGWEKTPKQKPLVISVPGMGSTGTPIEKVLELARKEGFSCGRFVFPHEPIQQTAYRLAQALRDIRHQAPERRVALVSYSLGGLIARAVIEDPELDPGNVRALIMLCPPNHGSLLLQLMPWKEDSKNGQTATPGSNLLVPHLKQPVQAAQALTGMAAVWADLRPGSTFLQRLNARPRNRNVRYTILLGDRAYLDPKDQETLQKWVAQLAPTPQSPGEKSFWQLISQLDELVHGRGDGAVSIARGRLEGVQDVHIFHFSHVGLLRAEWNSPEVRRAQELILDRLRTCPP